MQFLCLGYFDPEKMDARPKAEIDALMGDCRPHLEALYKTGQVIVDAGLDVKAKCVRRVKGKVMITDGPFTESKEMVGGAFLVEAKDLEEATRIACLHPSTQAMGEQFGWGLEIRPVHSFKMGEPR